MANVDFIRVDPEALNSECIGFLEDGAYGFGGITSVRSIFNNYNPGRDFLIDIRRDDESVGCIYLTVTRQDMGTVLTSILLGANGLGDWAAELRTFYYHLAKSQDCDQFIFMGRKGFKRYFAELEEVATVFRVNLKIN